MNTSEIIKAVRSTSQVGYGIGVGNGSLDKIVYFFLLIN